jgi:hypothetical protein
LGVTLHEATPLEFVVAVQDCAPPSSVSVTVAPLIALPVSVLVNVPESVVDWPYTPLTAATERLVGVPMARVPVVEDVT